MSQASVPSGDAEIPHVLTPPSRLIESTTPPLFNMRPQSPYLSGSPYTPRRTAPVRNSPSSPSKVSYWQVGADNYATPSKSRAPDNMKRTPGSRQRRESVFINVAPPPPPRFQTIPTVETDEVGESVTFNESLTEAEEHYKDRRPDFVMRKPIDTTRDVKIEDDEIATMVFREWGRSQLYGFWCLQHPTLGPKIVSYFMKGRHYRAWINIEDRFDPEPIAWPKGASSPRKASSTQDRHSTAVSDDWEEDDDNSTSHHLRERKGKQLHPYTMELRSSAVKREASVETPATSKKRRNSSKSGSEQTLSADDLPKASPPSDDEIKQRTRLNTYFADQQHVRQVLYLQDCPDMGRLFHETFSAWTRELRGTDAEDVQLLVRFPWLDDDSALCLRAGRPRSYERMLELIIKAPCWRCASDECVVNVEVVTG